MKRQRMILCLITMGALFFGGCMAGCSESVVSEDIGTGSIYSEMLVEVTSSGDTEVTVELNVGSRTGPNIELSAGDRLTASMLGTTQPLNIRTSWPHGVEYETLLAGNPPGEVVTIAFERDDFVDAPNSEVEVPETFSIMAPAAQEQFSMQDEISLEWTPAGTQDEMLISFEILCQEGDDRVGDTINFTRTDSGLEVFRVEDLIGDWEITSAYACGADIVITRKHTGIVDPGYGKGGEIFSLRSESVSVQLNP